MTYQTGLYVWASEFALMAAKGWNAKEAFQKAFDRAVKVVCCSAEEEALLSDLIINCLPGYELATSFLLGGVVRKARVRWPEDSDWPEVF